ncbi:MAG TPA: hypothetical protein VIT23_05205, partial [Terrimicrobiaceae bacterium]
MPQPKAFNHAGFVKINEQFYPCQVHEMSMTGARLDLAYPFDLPDTLYLAIDHRGSSRKVLLFDLAGRRRGSEYLAINPNAKVPAIGCVRQQRHPAISRRENGQISARTNIQGAGRVVVVAN